MKRTDYGNRALTGGIVKFGSLAKAGQMIGVIADNVKNNAGSSRAEDCQPGDAEWT